MDEARPVLICPFCGSKELIIENDIVTIERIRNKTYKDVEAYRTEAFRDVEMERIQLEKEKANKVMMLVAKESAQSFRKSKTAKFIIGCFVIDILFALLALSQGSILSGLIGILQVILLTYAWLVGNGAIKQRIQGLPTLLLVLAIGLSMAFLACVDL